MSKYYSVEAAKSLAWLSFDASKLLGKKAISSMLGLDGDAVPRRRHKPADHLAQAMLFIAADVAEDHDSPAAEDKTTRLLELLLVDNRLQRTLNVIKPPFQDRARNLLLYGEVPPERANSLIEASLPQVAEEPALRQR